VVPRKLSEAFAPYWGGGFFYFRQAAALQAEPVPAAGAEMIGFAGFLRDFWFN
jgi:hypothetical protein